MSDVAKEKAMRLLRKRESMSSLCSQDIRARREDLTFKTKDSISTVSYLDEASHHDENPRHAVQMENTYQLGPLKRFPVQAVREILMDVLSSYLQEEKYEPELCRQMTKTISEVVKARVKDLMIPRYKIVVMISIGQLAEQNLRMASRCLWDATTDTFSSYSFKNSSLFAVANVYALYFE
ncbi:dynein light chain Tctex-type 5 [Silurus meridionalis]|uniref:Tctex1 domain-containing protein 1 n=1 Tax=Silurus meridionalis TaxID=175797 RepID=A0A8T0BFL7_SILME|nr:dynein light chain Tctex-type 5 [Silurus meridionalis]KAF7705992.1 hypothetical protein HF521_019246 [Silurus meridionalis]KAI5103747.1 tctex1 domain-containing protein 1 [Silurus meridionalis]